MPSVLSILVTFSPPIPLRLYTLPFWSNRFLIFDILALWRSVARMSKIKNSGLNQYHHDAEPFEQQQFGTAGVEGAKLGTRLNK